jgi:hypothetical protein
VITYMGGVPGIQIIVLAALAAVLPVRCRDLQNLDADVLQIAEQPRGGGAPLPTQPLQHDADLALGRPEILLSSTTPVCLMSPDGGPPWEGAVEKGAADAHRRGPCYTSPVRVFHPVTPSLSQTTELTRVKTRIRALAEKTVSNGCTEAEALAAAEMVGRLLEHYALSMEEVDLRAEPCVQVEVPLPGRRRRPIDGCVPAIARFCDCKVWLARDGERPRYVFFGFDTDTAMAVYLFTVIDRGIRQEGLDFRVRHPALRGVRLRQASSSFAHGMGSRIAERLEALHAAREAGVAAQRPAGTALIVVRHSVVEEAFRATKVRLVAQRGAGIRMDGAYQQGYAAGERVNLHRPVNGTARDLLVR